MNNELVAAYLNWRTIDEEFPSSTGRYDRPRGHLIRAGKAWKKVERLIEAEGLSLSEAAQQLAFLP